MNKICVCVLVNQAKRSLRKRSTCWVEKKTSVDFVWL